MYHTISFIDDVVLDLERSPKHRLERVLVRGGTPVKAQIKPYVVETEDGPAEVADLFFEDGTATRGISFEHFAFMS